MRLFIGIKTGCEDYLSNLQEELRKCGRGSFTRSENMHLTLKFLGEVSPLRINEISDAMKDVTASPFTLECRGVKVFGRNGIISADVGGDIASLTKLASKLDDSLWSIGFARETRSFKPHITLAREFSAYPGCDISFIQYVNRRFKTNEIILFESARENGRLVYVPLFRKELT